MEDKGVVSGSLSDLSTGSLLCFDKKTKTKTKQTKKNPNAKEMTRFATTDRLVMTTELPLHKHWKINMYQIKQKLSCFNMETAAAALFTNNTMRYPNIPCTKQFSRLSVSLNLCNQTFLAHPHKRLEYKKKLAIFDTDTSILDEGN